MAVAEGLEIDITGQYLRAYGYANTSAVRAAAVEDAQLAASLG